MRSPAVVILWLSVLVAAAQAPAPIASLDSNVIRIGEQVQLVLRVAYRADQGGADIHWPIIGDTLPQHIEVVHDSGVDTILPNAQGDPYAFEQRRVLTITSFDSGYWAIEPLPFVVNGDSVESNALVITVNTVQVDTAQAIRDIKDIYTVPFDLLAWLKDHWGWIAGGAAVLAALITFVVWWVRRKPTPKPTALEPLIPLHQRALAKLDAIEKQRLWQQGSHKQYQSEVTDVLRSYVEERFGTPAMERTTDELMQELKMSSMHGGHREQLGNILRAADLVKFAKLLPAPSENEQLMTAARALINATTEPAGPSAVHQPAQQSHAR